MRRTLGFWALTMYGIGDILGAGVYALMGKVAGEAGPASWLAFLVAMFVAGLTGASYAELVSRYPRSGGEAAFNLEAFASPRLSFLIGWMVLCSGVVSMSAVAHACADYLAEFADIPQWPVWVTFLGLVAAINFWGIRQSSAANVVFTVIEASGLLLVISVGLWFLAGDGAPGAGAAGAANQPGAGGVMSGAALAFYAFIGFEDMVNVAEEVRDPVRVMPRAILATLVLATLLYVLTTAAVVMVVPLEDLSGSAAPLALVFARAPGAVVDAFGLVAVVATVNGILIQMIMASRVIYGLADRGVLPAFLSRVSERTRTPGPATALVVGLIILLTQALPIGALAQWTSQIVLSVFVLVNLSLIRLKLRGVRAEGPHFRVPLAVPVLGVVSSLGLFASALL